MQSSNKSRKTKSQTLMDSFFCLGFSWCSWYESIQIANQPKKKTRPICGAWCFQEQSDHTTNWRRKVGTKVRKNFGHQGWLLNVAIRCTPDVWRIWPKNTSTGLEVIKNGTCWGSNWVELKAFGFDCGNLVLCSKKNLDSKIVPKKSNQSWLSNRFSRWATTFQVSFNNLEPMNVLL